MNQEYLLREENRMIDYLTLGNISSYTINKIIENNTESRICDLSCNGQECLKIIEYMRQIGIKCIDELLINYSDIFLWDYEDFVNKINKLNVPYLVQCVNVDINAIEFIYN